jgi:hypothetical protein
LGAPPAAGLLVGFLVLVAPTPRRGLWWGGRARAA